MRFLIITHVAHKHHQNQWYAYAPYVREMNIWLKYVDELVIVAPKVTGKPSNIDMGYQHKNIRFNAIPAIQFTSLKSSFLSVFKLPIIILKIFKACQNADHIHLRCPGNIGLLGCLVQIFFPKTPKTAKYAGNWDPKAKQPLSYRLQKWILSNTVLTKNMQVLVYGNWKQQSKNIKPFFTASYYRSEIEQPKKRDYSGKLKAVFVGSLVEGKRPLLAVKIVEALYRQGREVSLHIYGDGVLKTELQHYIDVSNLKKTVVLRGNQSKETIKDALKKAHFLMLPSKSEGWPKAVAEAMFFGAIPIATPVSCLPDMLDYGNRGILIEADVDKAVKSILDALNQVEQLELMSKKAASWSQNYTLDVFESEIHKLIKQP